MDESARRERVSVSVVDRTSSERAALRIYLEFEGMLCL